MRPWVHSQQSSGSLQRQQGKGGSRNKCKNNWLFRSVHLPHRLWDFSMHSLLLNVICIGWMLVFNEKDMPVITLISISILTTWLSFKMQNTNRTLLEIFLMVNEVKVTVIFSRSAENIWRSMIEIFFSNKHISNNVCM